MPAISSSNERLNKDTRISLLSGISIYIIAGAIASCTIPLQAQSYQSSFTELTFDKGKTPFSNFGGVDVDIATGAASLTVPLGPGIGARGAVFRPKKKFYFHSVTRRTFAMTDTLTPYKKYLINWIWLVELNGGRVDVEIHSEEKTKTPFKPVITGYYSLEIPYHGYLGPKVGSRFEVGDIAGTVSNYSNTDCYNSALVLGRFPGYSNKSVGSGPRYEDGPPEPYGKRAGSNMLVYALAEDGESRIKTVFSVYKSGQEVHKYVHVPNTIVIIVGDTLYEMRYRNPGWSYRGSMVPLGGLDYSSPMGFRGSRNASYLLAKIVNTSGDEISFSYPHVARVESGADADEDLDESGGVGAPLPYTATWSRAGNTLGEIRVTESGEYQYSETRPTVAYRIYENRVHNVATDEWISFVPSRRPEDLTTIRMGKLDDPYREITLSWEKYDVLDTDSSAIRPVYARVSTTGVKEVVDKSISASGVSYRVTKYQRRLPKPKPWISPDLNLSSYFYAKPLQFDSLEFSTKVTNPDGTSTFYEFERPLQGWPNDRVGVEQNLRFCKNVVLSQEYFDKNGKSYGRAIFSDFRLNTLNNPNGSIEGGAVPYAIKTVDIVDGKSKTVEQSDWDIPNGRWRRIETTYFAQTGQLPIAAKYQSEYTFDTLHSSHFITGRATREMHTGQPLVSRTFTSPGYLPDSETYGSVDQLKLDYSYAAGLLKTVRLSGSSNGRGMAFSGMVGADYGHDAFGFVNQITPLRRRDEPILVSRQDHNLFGWPLSKTGVDGLVTSYKWSSSGALRKITPPSGMLETTISQSSDLRSIQVTRGVESTTYQYNGFGLVEKILSSGKGSKELTYYPSGALASETVYGNSAIRTEVMLDARNRISTITDPNGDRKTYEYDDLNNFKREIAKPVDGTTLTTTYGYDVRDKLRSVRDAKGQLTTYDYDPADRLIRVASGEQIRTWDYNELGWLTGIKQPESGITDYRDFSVHGQALSVINGATRRSYTIDSLGRVTGLSGSRGTSGGSVEQVFEYDASGGWGRNGELRSSSDGPIKQFYAYNENGLLSKLKTDIYSGYGASSPEFESYVQTFLYDNYGKRVQASIDHSDDNLTVNTSWNDALGLPEKSWATKDVYAEVDWRPDSGQPARIRYLNNQASTEMHYDRDQVRLKGLDLRFGNSLIKSWKYYYDSAGRMTSDGEDRFYYDELNRLKRADSLYEFGMMTEVLSQEYVYDRHGNMVKRTFSGMQNPPGAVNPFEFTAAECAALAITNQLPNNTTGAKYDDNGNLVEVRLFARNGAVVKMDYDALGRVISMSCEANRVYERYAYNTEGLRLRVQSLDRDSAANDMSAIRSVVHRIYNDKRQMVVEYRAAF